MKRSARLVATLSFPVFVATTGCGSVAGDAPDAASDTGVAVDAHRKDTGAHDAGRADTGARHDGAARVDAAHETGADAGKDGGHDSPDAESGAGDGNSGHDDADSGHEGADGGHEDAAKDTGVDAPPPFPMLPAINGAVSSVVHAGSSWFVGGSFQSVNQIPAPGFIGLSLDGAPASGCSVGSGFLRQATILAVVTAGSSIYVGGDFDSWNGVPANYIAKLDATTCALDTTFAGGALGGFDQSVSALAVSGSSLIVGGAFTYYRGRVLSTQSIAKIDLTTGALDTTFSPPGVIENGFDQPITGLAVSGSSVFAGGLGLKYRGASVGNVVKLSVVDASLDPTFATDAVPNLGVHALLVAGSALYAGGTLGAASPDVGTPYSVVKLDPSTGAIDPAFSPGAGGAPANTVYALTASATALYVGGNFGTVPGADTAAAQSIAKLDLATGALDTTFSPPGNNGFTVSGEVVTDVAVTALALDGTSLYVGGFFDAYRGVTEIFSMAKLDAATGSLDSTFSAGPAGNVVGFCPYDTMPQVNALAITGSTLFAGGNFSSYGGTYANGIAKFDDTTFALDTTFFGTGQTGGFDGVVATLVATDASLYVGGDFTAYQSVPGSANHVAKLDLATGALDTAWSPPAANGFDAWVGTFAVAGSSLYVGGQFTSYESAPANYIAKLDLTTGALDTSFSPLGFNAPVDDLAVAPPSIFAVGYFTAYQGVAASANYIAKLDLSTGSLDTTFSPPGATANGFDQAADVALVSGTSVYVGGFFSDYRGVFDSANRLVKLDISTGAPDTTFTPQNGSASGFDYAVNALQSFGGSLFVGGYFTAYRGVALSANKIAKLDPMTGNIDTTFNPVGETANGFDFAPAAGVNKIVTDGTSLFVGGDDFTTYRGAPVFGNLVLLSATGTLE